MPRRLTALFLLLLPLSLPAAEAPSRELAAELVARTGTVAVLAQPRVQAALSDPRPFQGEAAAPRRQRLLDESGFREWLAPRVWVLESRREGDQQRWVPVAPEWVARARVRGFSLLQAPPLPAAEQALGFLVPGQPSPALVELLGAYGADVLVLLRGKEWALWSPVEARRGILPAGSDLLPELLAETLAARQQWPEAGGRAVVQVDGAGSIADVVAVQDALQALPALRQPQLIRASRERLWFALAAPAAPELAVLLEAEPRLPALGGLPSGVGLTAAAREAFRLASPLLLRQWKPDALPPPVPEPGALQSPSL